MSRAARVSVVIPCYNAGRFLAETLASVFSQTVQPVEVLVVDDGSSDRSVEIARAAGGPVRVVEQERGGPSRARNHGFELAGGDWVAFLDADDLWAPTKLERQLAACTASTLCCHTGYARMFDDRTVVVEPNDAVVRGDYRLVNMLLHFMVNTSSALVRRSVGARFPESLHQGEDLIYFAEIALIDPHGFAYVPEPLTTYRTHGSSLSQQLESPVDARRGALQWLAARAGSIDARTRTEIESALVNDMLERLRVAKWKRDWRRYWSIREFLETIPAAAGEPLLRERPYPPLLYRLKDLADSLLRRH